LALATSLDIPVKEGDFSLTELYTAEEAFTTGTMGGLAHIAEVDGRRIGPADRSGPGPITMQLQEAYPNDIPSVPLPFVQ
jgi:branched-chain amino acid aminotransferase